ncbi:MAG: IS5 family transposase [Terriglobia bacterium]
MRGEERQQTRLFSYVSPEHRIPPKHPIRTIRQLVDRGLQALSPQFDALYATGGRPSIPPEQLLRALLLQVLFTVRSERQLMERIEYDLMFRWFVGLELDEPVWDVTVFTKNRDRLLAGEIAQAFFQVVLAEAQQRHLLSPEHFTIDGTLVRAWAGQKSFRRRRGRRRGPPEDDPGNPTVDFHGERRSNATHQSTTDPDARLAKKGAGHEAQLAYHGHVLMENRHGLAVGAAVTAATGTAEGEAARSLLPRRRGRRTLGADKGYDTRGNVAAWRALGVTPHVAQNTGRPGGSAIDQRTTRHPGYAVSQQKRKRVEEIFGWLKTIGLQRQTRFRGTARVAWMFVFATAAYNLVRMTRLLDTGGVP